MPTALNSLKINEEATALVDLWLSLPRRNAAKLPAKSDFNPMHLRRFLRAAVLYQRTPNGEVLARVAGTRVEQFIGQFITGKNILKLVPPEHSRAFHLYYEKLSLQPCAGTIERPVHSAGGGSYLVKTVHLPLLDEAGEATYFISVGVASGLPKHFTDYRSVAVRATRNLDISYVDIGMGIPDNSETTLARSE